MIIRDFSNSRADAVITVSAEVVWEDAERPPFDLRFEIPDAFAELVAPNPDAFLVAALYPASRAGERRIGVESAVCPYLVRGLEVALHWHRHWFGEIAPVIPIECGARSAPLPARNAGGAVVFFSGGADCLYTLRRNRLELPAGHSSSITHGILIEGFDMRRGNTYVRALAAASAVAGDAGAALIPVRTNVRDLDLDDEFWDWQFHGAALSSVAHVFAGSFALAYLASGIEIASLFPVGIAPARRSAVFQLRPQDPPRQRGGHAARQDSVTRRLARSARSHAGLLSAAAERAQLRRVRKMPSHAACDVLGLTLVPIRSNIPSLDNDYELWTHRSRWPGLRRASACARAGHRAHLAGR